MEIFTSWCNMMANLLSACEEKMKVVAVENQYMKPRIITDKKAVHQISTVAFQ